ncbi:unnamed protein product, partial [Didymodactylos carnosus]
RTLTMQVLVILCIIFITGTFCAPANDKILDESWNLFKNVYAKEYKSYEDETYRRDVWEANVAKIRKHNLEADLGIHTYTMKMNKYGDMTHREFVKQMNGLKINIASQATEFDQHEFMAPSYTDLPVSVDWRKQGYVTEVKDQGQCGSCWAFSATGSLEGQHFRKYNELVSLSEQNLLDCSDKFGNMGCNGGLMIAAFEYIKENNGIDTEKSYPYEAVDRKCRFKSENIGATDVGYAFVKQGNETDLQNAIATVGPIAVAIDASQDSFQFYSSGVYDEPMCSSTDLDHGVLAVGYDVTSGKHGTPYYIVKNSWGEGWGDDGYIWMTRNERNQCGIATMASYPFV